MISSRKNPLVHRLRKLSSPQGRDDASILLLEGTNLLKEALKTGCMPSEIVATSSWVQKHSEIIQELSSDVEYKIVTEKVLQASLTTVSPDGVASLLTFEALPQSRNEPDFVLALDRLQDPGNLGSLFRTSLAAEIQEIWLVLGADPLGQKVLRSSVGAVLHLPFKRISDFEQIAINQFVEMLDKARNRGLQVIGTYGPNSSVDFEISPYWQVDWRKPTVLVLGNEGSGLHPKVQTCCTHAVTLPHNEIVESLNVASAAVPILLERFRAKMTS